MLLLFLTLPSPSLPCGLAGGLPGVKALYDMCCPPLLSMIFQLAVHRAALWVDLLPGLNVVHDFVNNSCPVMWAYPHQVVASEVLGSGYPD